MLKKVFCILLSLVCLGLTACGSDKNDPNTVIVGTIAGPETTLMQVAKEVAKKRYGLKVKIVTFSDYNTPNVALSDGSLDANAFQHMPYLDEQNKQHGYNLVSVGKTFLYPMAIYSNHLKKLSDIKNGSKVAIPNDPSNEARALLLLQKAGLITLRKGAGLNATPIDISSNPKKLQFIALDAAELPRALQSVAIAVINTNYAIPAGLSPSKDGLFEEGTDSPYTDIIAARADNAHSKKIRELVAAYQSQAVVDKAKQIFGDGAIPGFRVSVKAPVKTKSKADGHVAKP